MTGDPLDRIEERGRRSLARGAIEVTFPTEIVLALVAVARAARVVHEQRLVNVDDPEWMSPADASLHAALAKLDGAA